jgi:PTS system ascorbate-specific IIC component
MVAIILSVAGFEGVQLIYTGSLSLGMMMAIFPAIAQPYMRRMWAMTRLHCSYRYGGLRPVRLDQLSRRQRLKSTEEMNMPQNLSFLRDSTISISLTMMVIYGSVCVSRKEFVESHFSHGQNYLVYSFIQAITFAAVSTLFCRSSFNSC